MTWGSHNQFQRRVAPWGETFPHCLAVSARYHLSLLWVQAVGTTRSPSQESHRETAVLLSILPTSTASNYCRITIVSKGDPPFSPAWAQMCDLALNRD